MGNPVSRGQQRDKPYRDALRMEQVALANGEKVKHPPGSLRAIAQRRLLMADSDEGHADAKEIADRLDGKVPQGIVGDDESDPLRIETIRRIIVRPEREDSGGVPPATGADPV